MLQWASFFLIKRNSCSIIRTTTMLWKILCIKKEWKGNIELHRDTQVFSMPWCEMSQLGPFTTIWIIFFTKACYKCYPPVWPLFVTLCLEGGPRIMHFILHNVTEVWNQFVLIAGVIGSPHNLAWPMGKLGVWHYDHQGQRKKERRSPWWCNMVLSCLLGFHFFCRPLALGGGGVWRKDAEV